MRWDAAKTTPIMEAPIFFPRGDSGKKAVSMQALAYCVKKTHQQTASDVVRLVSMSNTYPAALRLSGQSGRAPRPPLAKRPHPRQDSACNLHPVSVTNPDETQFKSPINVEGSLVETINLQPSASRRASSTRSHTATLHSS